VRQLYLVLFLLSLISISCSDSEVPIIDDPESLLPFKNVSDTHLPNNRNKRNTMDGHVVDINRDGYPDIVLAIEFAFNLILINDGNGRLVDESSFRIPRTFRDSEDIAVADFDGDGDDDIVFVSEDDEENEFFLNDGTGKFTDESSRIPLKGFSNAVEAFDIDADGDMDLIIGNRGQNYILLNDGTGFFINASNQRYPSSPDVTQDIELADVDNDGDLDILEANEAQNRILINDGKGFFTDETSDRLPEVIDQTREVDLADIDNDGDLDILFANVYFGGVGDPQNRLLVNDGTGIFFETTDSSIPLNDYSTVDADFFDINSDGNIDIISGNKYQGMSDLVLINNGEGVFEDKTLQYFPSISTYAFDFQFADFNMDGLTDIYICNFRGFDVLLFGQ